MPAVPAYQMSDSPPQSSCCLPCPRAALSSGHRRRPRARCPRSPPQRRTCWCSGQRTPSSSCSMRHYNPPRHANVTQCKCGSSFKDTRSVYTKGRTFTHLAQCGQIFCGFVTSPRPQPPHSTHRGQSVGGAVVVGLCSSSAVSVSVAIVLFWCLLRAAKCSFWALASKVTRQVIRVLRRVGTLRVTWVHPDKVSKECDREDSIRPSIDGLSFECLAARTQLH